MVQPAEHRRSWVPESLIRPVTALSNSWRLHSIASIPGRHNTITYRVARSLLPRNTPFVTATTSLNNHSRSTVKRLDGSVFPIICSLAACVRAFLVIIASRTGHDKRIQILSCPEKTRAYSECSPLGTSTHGSTAALQMDRAATFPKSSQVSYFHTTSKYSAHSFLRSQTQQTAYCPRIYNWKVIHPRIHLPILYHFRHWLQQVKLLLRSLLLQSNQKILLEIN